MKDTQEHNNVLIKITTDLSPTNFYQFLLTNKDSLIKEILNDGYAPQNQIVKEFDLALDFIKYAEGLKLKVSNIPETVFLFVDSLFQVLLEIYAQCFLNIKMLECLTIPSLSSIPKAIFNINPEKLGRNPLEPSDFYDYTTMIVTENADMHSAVDEITKSFKNLRSPWMIHRILVQENIQDRFLILLERNLPKIDPIFWGQSDIVLKYESHVKKFIEKGIKLIQAPISDVLKATIAVGAPMTTDMRQVPIVILEPFRTSKEAITLFNKQHMGNFVSIWSENITEAFEYIKCLTASTLWINSYGVLNAKCPVVILGTKYDMNYGKK